MPVAARRTPGGQELPVMTGGFQASNRGENEEPYNIPPTRRSCAVSFP
jgi:hypothetical protein